MSLMKTIIGLTKRLNTLSPSLPTGYEGAKFDPPTTIYQRVQFVPRKPDDPVFGRGYYRERVEMQVFINAPLNKGTGEALTRAELVRNHFKKGTKFTEDSVVLHVLETPRIAGTAVISDRVVVPVLIDVIAEVLCD